MILNFDLLSLHFLKLFGWHCYTQCAKRKEYIQLIAEGKKKASPAPLVHGPLNLRGLLLFLQIAAAAFISSPKAITFSGCRADSLESR